MAEDCTNLAAKSSLPTNANLARWRKIASENCSLCGIKQTQRHVVSFCSSALNNGRFTCRHNSVLYTICQHLSSLMKNGNKLYADFIVFESTSSLFESSRPDACIVTANGEVLPLELTVCHELNFENYYLLTGCEGRTVKYQARVFEVQTELARRYPAR